MVSGSVPAPEPSVQPITDDDFIQTTESLHAEVALARADSTMRQEELEDQEQRMQSSDPLLEPLPAPGTEEHEERSKEALFVGIFDAARHNKHTQVSEMLLRGADPDMRDEHGNTPLIIAVQNGNKKISKALLRRGANVNFQNHQGNTALHYAYKFGYTSLGQYLLSKGADDGIHNIRGRTCYEES